MALSQKFRRTFCSLVPMVSVLLLPPEVVPVQVIPPAVTVTGNAPLAFAAPRLGREKET